MSASPELDELRRSLQERGLRPADLAADPFVQFQAWFDEARAAGLHEPEAMVVSSVGADGLPSSRYVLLKGLDLRHIYFDFDKHDLRGLSAEQLDRIIKVMQQHNDLRIEIYGHTDAKGSVTYNQALSSRRANAAYRYLTQAGATNVDIVLRAQSELQPIDSNDTDTGRQNNRRVEFTILYKGEVLVKSQP